MRHNTFVAMRVMRNNIVYISFYILVENKYCI